MNINQESMQAWLDRLEAASVRVTHAYPGEGADRQPVHTVYGGAHLFKANTASRLGELARRALDEHAGDPRTLADAVGLVPVGLAEQVYERVRDKLEREPVEDFRLDFEDGYGNRPDEEEDGDAVSAAAEVSAGMEAGTLPPFLGIRIKPLSGELGRRSIRTLELFVSSLVEQAGALPANFVVTLPKIQDVEQVMVLDEALAEIETKLGIERMPIELMLETPQMVIDRDGTVGARRYVQGGQQRVRGVHFGTYDYTASMNITAAHQSMTHPACDFARNVMQVSLAGTGIWLSDGATNVMPVGDRQTVHGAWRLHYSHIRHSLMHGLYQGWDLHPAQLPTRYAAIYSFFMEGLDKAGERLSTFVDQAAQATLVGEVFDDAATGQGLLNYFLRAINCRAITAEEALDRTGLTVEELETRSFLLILEARR
ncbi:MAG TPA: phosphoenolpyruvate kinase [Acidimicrobiia bacterium]|nr:phosphoenolpyruvate kinase [Acidimicrobiia bacterium]